MQNINYDIVKQNITSAVLNIHASVPTIGMENLLPASVKYVCIF